MRKDTYNALSDLFQKASSPSVMAAAVQAQYSSSPGSGGYSPQQWSPNQQWTPSPTWQAAVTYHPRHHQILMYMLISMAALLELHSAKHCLPSL